MATLCAKTLVQYVGTRGRNAVAEHRCISDAHDQEKPMNSFGSPFKPPMWFMRLLLCLFQAL